MKKKKIVIASDSFKGTLSSLDICHLFRDKLSKNNDISPLFLPIADGGEGSLEALSYAVEGRFAEVEVTDLYFNKIKASFYIDKDNNAYIEAASSVGLGLAKKDNDPGLVTTYGLGEQIRKAIELGSKNIYLFLGGSASNDGGVGLASALLTKFYNKDNQEYIPTGLTLKDITHIDNHETLELLNGINLIALSDVASPFYGKEGAAYKFAPQKGASSEEVVLLDEGLQHLSSIIKRDLGIDISTTPGTGAAGGLGGGLVAFANASIKSGINALLDIIHFDAAIKDADYVISGEGKLDKQTLDGKVIDGIAKRCLKQNKDLLIIVGVSEIPFEEVNSKYPCIKHIYETNEKHLPFEDIKANALDDYIKQIDKLLADYLD